ncbi:MAG: crossover junction endodeoxyribonuclease RuvC [Candidatus Omnitrophota bacterium]|jgi:crossover junction endodeoxyribonuclease RuvC
MIICGIDVGLLVCGYCICEVQNARVHLIKEGEVKTAKKQDFPEKLEFIYEELRKEIEIYKPKAIILEKLYSHHRHPTTLGVLAQVRGVVVLLSKKSQTDLFEYAPTRARKAFLGQGNANSLQVKKMAENFTGGEFKSNHTADAFSLVIAFAHEEKVRNLNMVVQ